MTHATENPKLTVLMAVYNGVPYLETAIDSILNQTYSNFLFLIIDDASTDSTREVIKSYNDSRIRLRCLEQNVGQTAALSIGLRQVETAWVARMDADDYSAPTRFEEQIAFLESYPCIKCLGTYAWTFRKDPKIVEDVIVTPLHNDDINRELLKGSPIIHGSLIAATEALLDVGGYDDRYPVGADLELYDRLLPIYPSANFPKQLLGIRIHELQGSRTQSACADGINICTRRLLNNSYSEQESAIVRVTLCHAHLVRAHFFAARFRFLEMSKDILRSTRISPKAFIWHFILVFVIGTMPQSIQTRLKRIVVKILKKP